MAEAPRKWSVWEKLLGPHGRGAVNSVWEMLRPPNTQEIAEAGPADMGLIALGAIPGLGAPARALSKAKKARPPPLRAYHGSPHEFDAFDLSRTGTGSGMAMGRGVNVSPSREFAEYYRQPDEGSLGSLLELDVHSTLDELIDLDKPIREQIPAVQEALSKAGYVPRGDLPARLALGINLKDPNFISKLEEQGIKGTRMDKDLGMNIFNPKNIDILKRYGLFGALGLGGVASQMGEQETNPGGS